MAEGSSAWQNGGLDPLLHPLLERAARMDEDLSILQYTLSRSARRRRAAVRLDYDSWADDLERVAGHLARQEFQRADALLARWSPGPVADQLDGMGMWLRGRSLMLMGDAQRDRGRVAGPLSAESWYRRAEAVFDHLHEDRRAAQAGLSRAVVAEMSGQVLAAADRYCRFARDERLSERDRARACLWLGTALSKTGQYQNAISAMAESARLFEKLDEPEDWAVAHQKIGLAQRSAGLLDDALHHIAVARELGTELTPLQRVRLDTAHAHCLLSDPTTRTEGSAMLRRSKELAIRYELAHQLRSIETIGIQFP